MARRRNWCRIRRVGLEAQMIDPTDPQAGVIKVKLNEREPVESVRFSFDNFTRGIESFNFWRYLGEQRHRHRLGDYPDALRQQHGGLRAQ